MSTWCEAIANTELGQEVPDGYNQALSPAVVYNILNEFYCIC